MMWKFGVNSIVSDKKVKLRSNETAEECNIIMSNLYRVVARKIFTPLCPPFHLPFSQIRL